MAESFWEGGRSLNLEEQYDRIFKYLYFHLHDRYMAEDLTQETFLRFLESRTYQDENRQLQYLYTIARNLCRQYYRDKTTVYSLDEALDCPLPEDFEQTLVDRISLIDALQKISDEERELLFLRYVNDVPVPVLSRLYHISRFAVYRRLKKTLEKLKDEMQ
jgi:RNA polymerase sigma-70 factor (ECF subfamily)